MSYFLIFFVIIDIDMFSKFYERYMLVGDFNTEELESCLSQFLFEMNAKNILKNLPIIKV